MELTRELVRRAPKVLLHDHLDGGLRPGTVLELAAATGHRLPADTESSLATWAMTEGRLLVLKVAGSTSKVENVEAALRLLEDSPAFATGEPINIENYGRVADGLRRDLRVAEVVCLAT